MSSAEPALVRTFDLGDGQAAKDEELAAGSPALAVLMTRKDNPRAWLAAGQALERILLLARSENVWCSFLISRWKLLICDPNLCPSWAIQECRKMC